MKSNLSFHARHDSFNKHPKNCRKRPQYKGQDNFPSTFFQKKQQWDVNEKGYVYVFDIPNHSANDISFPLRQALKANKENKIAMIS